MSITKEEIIKAFEEQEHYLMWEVDHEDNPKASAMASGIRWCINSINDMFNDAQVKCAATNQICCNCAPACEHKKPAAEGTTAYYWIYDKNNDMFPGYDDFFKKIEKALGFELFVWQKTYIITGTIRRSGETLAEILRALLRDPCTFIDFSFPARTRREAIFRKELTRIKKILNDSGIETKPVITSTEEKAEYFKFLKDQIKNGKEDIKNIGLYWRGLNHD